MLNGSGIFFDDNAYYPHWYKNFFNKTIPLFGPYAWRADDFYGTRRMSSYFEYIIVSFFLFCFVCKDSFNWKNEWTNETIQEEDIGAGRNHHYTSRYNHAREWYSKWLPDRKQSEMFNE